MTPALPASAHDAPGAPESMSPLRVVVGSVVDEELCRWIEQAEPRVQVIRRQDLYRPMRFAADHEGDPDFVRTPEQQREFEDMIDSADVLYGVPDMDPAQLARTVRANPRLRWVQTMPAGGGAQVKAAGLAREDLDRIVFTTAAGVHGEPLAEFALLGILAGAKNLPRLQRDQRKHEWPERRWEMRQVKDMTVLVIGLGGIGQAVAAKLSGLGATTWGTSRRDVEVPGVDRVVPMVQMEEAAAQADAVVVTLPGTERTEKLLGATFFRGLKEGAVLVNVGRGSVIDEPELIRALQEGRVGFAALDVTAVEPLDPESPLWDFPQVLISPHSAALSDQEPRRITELFVRNLTAFLDGRPLQNVVDTVEFY